MTPPEEKKMGGEMTFADVPGEWGVHRDEYGYARAITKGGEYFAIHLETGTVRNEKNIDAFVDLLKAHAARVKVLVEALEAAWPFLEEDEELCITPGYAEAIQKVRKAREVYRNGK